MRRMVGMAHCTAGILPASSCDGGGPGCGISGRWVCFSRTRKNVSSVGVPCIATGFAGGGSMEFPNTSVLRSGHCKYPLVFSGTAVNFRHSVVWL